MAFGCGFWYQNHPLMSLSLKSVTCPCKQPMSERKLSVGVDNWKSCTEGNLSFL